MIRWLWLCAFALMLCGCLESKAEFNAINLGKVNAIYENGALRIIKSNKSDSNKSADLSESTSNSRGSIFDESQRVVSEAKQKSGLRSHEQGNRTDGSLTKRVANLPDLSQKDNASPFVLFFFTTSCGVCKAQIPILQEIASESVNNGARIYAIVGDTPNEQKAWQYAQSNAISLPLFYESEAKRFFSQIVGGVKGVPAIVVFDKDGRVKERFIGLTPKSIISGALSFFASTNTSQPVG